MKKLFTFFALCSAVRLLAITPVPFTEAVTFNMRMQGNGSASMTIYEESGSPSSWTFVTGGLNEAWVSTAWMRPGKKYTMNVNGSGAGYYCWLSFILPDGYSLFVDNYPRDMVDLGWLTTFNQDHTLELRPRANGSAAAPLGSFSGISVGRSISWEIGLGALHGERNAGRITFKEYDLTNSPSSRSRLYLGLVNSINEVWSINDGPSNQTLRQVMTPLGVIDILDDGSGGYRFRFFLHSQSEGSPGNPNILYGDPWKTIHVQNPASGQLKITETEGSVTRVSLLTLTSGSVSSGNYVWTLQEGNGTTWLRTTTHTSTTDGAIVATGGALTTNGGYTTHTFTGSGTFNVSAAPANSSVDYLVVAGGGGGGGATGGGGGAGGFLTGNLPITAQAYSITVGAGGTGGSGFSTGGNGGNSVFSSITSTGGGGGGYNGANGVSGGSGGGAGHASGSGGLSTTGQGNNGGNGGWDPRYPGGGGGGAGGAGATASSYNGGNGGAGSASSITGSSVTYAGGGGGGVYAAGYSAAGSGGSGGGGHGGGNDTGPTAASANTGGGGGGCGNNGSAGAAGGSGIVVIRYATGTAYRDVIEVVRTGDTSGTIVSKTRYRYQNVGGWGEELTQVVSDPDTAALTSAYTYYTNSSNLGNYRKVRSVTGPTGNWTGYEYYDDWDRRGQLKYEFHPHLDSPATVPSSWDPAAGRVIYLEYNTADWTGRYTRPTLKQEKVNNVQTAKVTFSHGDTSTSYGPQEYSYTYSYSDASTYRTDYVQRFRADAWPTLAFREYARKNADLTQTSWISATGNYNPSTGEFYDVNVSNAYIRHISLRGSTSSSGADSVASWGGQNFATVYLLPNKSTMDTVIYAGNGLAVRTETWVYTGSGNFSLMTFENLTYDSQGRLTQRVASNGATVTNTYTGGRITSTVGIDGTETQFTYDLIGRVATTVKKGAAASGNYAAQGDITTTNTYDGAGHVTQAQTTGGALSLTTSAVYDLAGRLTSSTAPGNYTTGHAYTSGGKVVTTTLPGGATKINEVYVDGQAKSLTGTAVVAEHFTHNIQSDGTRELVHRQVSTSGPITEYVYRDWLGRQRLRQVPSPSGSGYTDQYWLFNSAGQLYQYSQTGKAATLYNYDTLGRLYREGLDINANGTLDLASEDRITETEFFYYLESGVSWWARTQKYVYSTAASSTRINLSDELSQLSAFASGRLSQTNSYDRYWNVTITSVDVDRANKRLTTTTYTPDSNVSAEQIAYNGLLMSARDTTNKTTTFGFDALGRQTQSIDPRTGTTTTSYISGTNLVYQVKDPVNVAQATYEYDGAARVGAVTNALGKATRYEYNTRNQKVHEWGEAAYPVEYGYDDQGRQTTMKTYRGGSNWTGAGWPTGSTGTADTTQWNFHGPTGLLTSKVSAYGTADAKTVSYTYTQAGQIATRTWARGVVTSYGYSSATGELLTVDYGDTTPDLIYTYNRLGRQATVVDGTGTRTFTYNLGGTLELQREDLPGFFDYRRITYIYDTTGSGTKGRLADMYLGVGANPTQDQTNDYYYNSDGRLGMVFGWSAGHAGQYFNYNYTTGSRLIANTYNTAVGYTDTRTYDPYHDWTDSRVTSISSSTKAAFAYGQDSMGRVTALTKTDEIFNRYGNGTQGLLTGYDYNTRSELTNEITYLASSGFTVLTGRNNTYGFDNIGNRSTVTHNGDTATYTTDGLNRYTQRTVPGIFDIAGAAEVSATVTVNGSSSNVYRHGGYFFKWNGLNNNPNPVFSIFEVSDGSTTSNLPAFLAGTPEAMTYDDDGNLKTDGRWNYGYDAENRLVSMQTNAAAVAAGVTQVTCGYEYDYLGRRVRVVSSTWSGSGWVDRRLVYQGWNLVADFYGPYNGGNFPTGYVQNFFWGLDLSGTMQGAGGVGGLLMVQEGGQSYLPIYDAMGNVHGMIKASDGTVAAAYEYDAFGQTLRESGPYAASNPFRYSTKYTDIETGLVYYGLRYYSPTLGRFINNDPIEEQGGLNLYGFCGNNGVNRWDMLGMFGQASLRSTIALYGERGNTGQSTGGGSVGSLTWAWSTGLGVAVDEMDSLMDSMSSGVGPGVAPGVIPARENRAVVSAADLRALQDRATLESIGLDTTSMGNGQVLDLAVSAGVSNSVQQVNAGTQLNGLSMALIGISLGMASPLIAVADAIENPSLRAPLNIAASTLAGAGAIIGAPASVLTGDAFDTYTVASSNRAYMNGIFTSSAMGDEAARRIGASYLNNDSHYFKVGDIAQILLDTVGIITAPGINTALSAITGTSQFAFHSQGTATGANGLRLVPASMRNDLDVVGVGGQWHLNATVLGYHSATNLTASKDPVPYLSPNNYLSRVLSGRSTTNRTNIPNAVNKVNIANHNISRYAPYIPPSWP